jgi:hypothetical protein
MGPKASQTSLHIVAEAFVWHESCVSRFQAAFTESEIEKDKGIGRGGKGKSHTGAKKTEMKWQAHTQKVFDDMGLPGTFDAWTARPEFKGLGLSHLPRVRACVNAAWAHRLTSLERLGISRADAHIGYWVDASQCISRKKWGRLGTVQQNSMKYSFELDLCLTGLDVVALLGLPHSAVLKAKGVLSESDLRSLGGEAFSAPCIGACVYMYYLNRSGPWWQGS